MTSRIATRFADLHAAQRTALVTFVTAGDPNEETSATIIRSLPAAGADLIEIGMPFSDPMADGSAIQAANLRALANGMTLKKTLALLADFRTADNKTPVVLMGYANPIMHYGLERFYADAAKAGADGTIVVDVPPEEDAPWVAAAEKHGMAMIKLIAPTTPENRIGLIAARARGFIYHVSVTGITGAKTADAAAVQAAVQRIRQHTSLPIVAGFGISTPEQVKALKGTADGIVVGSAIVRLVENGQSGQVAAFVGQLAAALR